MTLDDLDSSNNYNLLSLFYHVILRVTKEWIFLLPTFWRFLAKNHPGVPDFSCHISLIIEDSELSEVSTNLQDLCV